MRFKIRLVGAMLALTLLLLSTMTSGQDYDSELLPSAKGEAEPYPPSPPPPPNPEEIPVTEGPDPNAFVATFYEAHPPDGDKVELEVSSSCQNLEGQSSEGPWNEVVSDIELPAGKCMRLYDKPDCGGTSLDYTSKNPKRKDGWFLTDVGWDNRAQSFIAIPCETAVLPCQVVSEAAAQANKESYSATFFEGYRSDKTEFYRNITGEVTSSCANVPTDLAGGRNIPWNTEISDMLIPERSCICLFDQVNCGGESFYSTLKDDENYLINHGFNDRTKSYRVCNIGLPPEPNEFVATFYEDHPPEGDKVDLEASTTCQNLNDQSSKGPWNEVVSHIELPEGKCLRLHDKPDCGGKSVDYKSNHPKRENGWFLPDVGWDNRVQSFVAIPCEMAVLPCQDVPSSAAEANTEKFSATFFEGYRSDKTQFYRNITAEVTSSCGNVPTDLAGGRNIPWNTEISDMLIPERACICLFDQVNCGGEGFYSTLKDDENYLINHGFNDKIKSYRVCNGGGS